MTINNELNTTRTLSADEVRALKDRPAALGNKQKFLDAIWGGMSEAEADEFERRINQSAEVVDDDNDCGL